MGREKQNANLIPASDPKGHKLTVEEQSMGAKRSAEVRARNKKRGEIWAEIMNTPLTDEKFKANVKLLGIEEEELTIGKYLKIKSIVDMLKKGAKVDDLQKIDDEIFGKMLQKTEQTVIAPKPLVDLTERKKNGE